MEHLSEARRLALSVAESVETLRATIAGNSQNAGNVAENLADLFRASHRPELVDCCRLIEWITRQTAEALEPLATIEGDGLALPLDALRQVCEQRSGVLAHCVSLLVLIERVIHQDEAFRPAVASTIDVANIAESLGTAARSLGLLHIAASEANAARNKEPAQPSKAALAVSAQHDAVMNIALALRNSARVIHQVYEFEDDQPDLAYLCELGGFILDHVTLGLQELIAHRNLCEQTHSDLLEVQRKYLRWSRQLLLAQSHFLRTTPTTKATDLLILFDKLAESCSEATDRLDHGNLDIPIPQIFSEPDEENSVLMCARAGCLTEHREQSTTPTPIQTAGEK